MLLELSWHVLAEGGGLALPAVSGSHLDALTWTVPLVRSLQILVQVLEIGDLVWIQYDVDLWIFFN